MERKQILLIALFSFAFANEENYCDPSLCDDGQTHTACDHYVDFGQDCGEDPEIMIITAVHKKLILDLHNQNRNKISSGRLPGYDSASRMPALRWNDDLAYVAGIHARSCTAENDDCRNTQLFKNVGQNIAYDIDSDPEHNVTTVIKRVIDSWYSENQNGNHESIEEFTSDISDSMGRFAMIVNDRSSDVGCAFVRFTNGDSEFVGFFTCNYGSNVRLGLKIYETGPPCSNCETGCNKIWAALCSSEEKIYPNRYNNNHTR